MSTPTELWKNWEGRVVDGKIPLLRWLGGSDHSAVFLTKREGADSPKAAVKLISAENLDEDDQLSLWVNAASLSNLHLIRLFEHGLFQLDDTRLLYVVMEYAEENLAQILPLRPLEPSEISEMLAPTAQALAYLHDAGYVHGSIQPSNIMAADDQLKISADGIRKIGARAYESEAGAYQAREVFSEGHSPASDVWSLGATVVAAITQRKPLSLDNNGDAAVPETLPEPLREIARRCLRADPQQRCGMNDVLTMLQGGQPHDAASSEANVVHAPAPQTYSGRWIVVLIVIAGLLLVAFASRKFRHQPQIPAAEVRPAQRPAAHSDIPAASSPAPFAETKKRAPSGTAHGSVLQQVMPEVSRSAQNTIQGKIKVSVRVEVDTSGNVSQATVASAGPSKYFANRALAAARSWKFNPPQEDGRALTSEWLLRFQFGRASTQVIPAEVNVTDARGNSKK